MITLIGQSIGWLCRICYWDAGINSWEPEENLDACKRLLGSFWEYFGPDNKDHFPGEELEPSEAWISEFFLNQVSVWV